jgi:hypothetical protein
VADNFHALRLNELRIEVKKPSARKNFFSLRAFLECYRLHVWETALWPVSNMGRDRGNGCLVDPVCQRPTGPGGVLCRQDFDYAPGGDQSGSA